MDIQQHSDLRKPGISVRFWSLALLSFFAGMLVSGCSIKKIAINKLADALADCHD